MPQFRSVLLGSVIVVVILIMAVIQQMDGGLGEMIRMGE